MPNQIVFKPRASLVKFSRFFPPILAGLGVLFILGLAAGYWLKQPLIPVMMAVPIFSIAGGAIYANRLTQGRIVIDMERIRIIEAGAVKANLPWNQITRLTMRQDGDDTVHEMWVKQQAIPLRAAYFEDGDKLLAAVSARTNRGWETLRPS